MKKIKIQQITKPDKTSVYIRDKYYYIYLGDSRYYYFKNEVKARQFLAETNRFLNAVLHELNSMYSQILIEYRSIWFYIEGNLINLLPNQIYDLEKLFNLLIKKSSHYINGNPYTMQYLNKICTLLLNIAFSLRSVIQEKEYYHQLQKMDMIINNLNSIHEKLANWGKNYPGTILDVK